MVWALLGSGEFQPWSRAVDGLVLREAAGDGRVLILPTASAPEGDEVFDRWGAMGLEHFAAQGIPAEVVPLKTSRDAQRSELAERLAGASVAYFSGGNPAYLAATLAGSRFWTALQEAMARGLGYVGCSGGVACLGAVAPDSGFRHLTPELWRPGLGVFPGTLFAPHWDTVEAYVPGLRRFVLEAVPPGGRVVGLDERTAMVGDGTSWRVIGAGAIHVLEDGEWGRHGAEARFVLPISREGSPSPDG